MTGDLEDRAILDTTDHLEGPQGRYPESFMSLSLFLAEILVCYHGNKKVTDRQILLNFNIDKTITSGENEMSGGAII